MTNRSTNEELQERYEFAAQLIGRGQSKSLIVEALVEKYGVTPQQARTYKREGAKIFKETIYEDGTVADAVELEYFVILDNLKEDRLRAIDAENLTAVASINKTRLKLVDMARTIDPGSSWDKELDDYYVQACKEHIDDKLKPRTGKIPRKPISTGWETNATEEEIEDWERMAKEKNLDITGMPKYELTHDIPW